MRNAGLDESQAGIKIAVRNTNNLRYADDTTLMEESGEELKSLDEGERGEWKNWLEIQHSESKIMASGPIAPWQTEEEKDKAVTDFLFLGSSIITQSVTLTCLTEEY